MKYGIECIGRPFLQENTGFAPWNFFRSDWRTEFTWIGSQTNGRNLIERLYKSIKISWKLNFYSG